MPQTFPLKEIVQRRISDWRTGDSPLANAVIVEDNSPASMDINPAFILSPGSSDWYRISTHTTGMGGEPVYFPMGIVKNKELIGILNSHLSRMRTPHRAMQI